MSTHFIAHPVTAGMGLRESINAMLDHVARGQSYGYPGDTLGASNYRSLLRDFGPDGDYGTQGLVVEHSVRMTDCLRLVPHVPGSYPGKLAGQAGHLAHLVDTLLELCNDYPLYDEQDHSELESERSLEAIEEARKEGDPEAHDILGAFSELGLCIEHESDGNVYMSEAHFAAAVEYAPTFATEHGPTVTPTPETAGV